MCAPQDIYGSNFCRQAFTLADFCMGKAWKRLHPIVLGLPSKAHIFEHAEQKRLIGRLGVLDGIFDNGSYLVSFVSKSAPHSCMYLRTAVSIKSFMVRSSWTAISLRSLCRSDGNTTVTRFKGTPLCAQSLKKQCAVSQVHVKRWLCICTNPQQYRNTELQ